MSLNFGISGVAPSQVGGVNASSGSTIKYFPRIYLGGNPSYLITQTPPTTPSVSNATGALFLPAGGALNSQIINVLAAGTFGNDTGDPSGTVNVGLYAVTGKLLSPVYTPLATTGALTPSVLGIINNWAISAELYGDSGSGLFGGSYAACQNGLLVNSTPKSVDNVISGLDFTNGNFGSTNSGIVLGLAIGVTFGTSNATNIASLYQFEADF